MLKDIAILSFFYIILTAVAIYHSQMPAGVAMIFVVPSIAVVYAAITSTMLMAGRAVFKFVEGKSHAKKR